MISSHKNIIIVVAALFLFVGLVVVGCSKKKEPGWVNTQSMPGKTFSRYVKHNGASTIVYLDADSKQKQDVNFGPSDISFEFRDLR